MQEALLDNEDIDRIQEINRTSFAYNWKNIPVDGLPPATQNIAHRLNGLGDNFYFIKGILRKHRLSNLFHRQYCQDYLCWSLKEVFEIPRDHFKTTIGCGMAMWWALPFNDKDEKFMRQLGYGDDWIDWMRRVHDQNTRTLIAMEVIKNAWKVGKKIASEYENNTFFRKLFPEILPDSSCQWTADTLTHKRDFSRSDANQGEGTYEFTGVDAALQSKHYKRAIYDDLFGREALKSELVAQSTWEWFQLAVGAFDSDATNNEEECDEIVNGNRWSYHDLNYTIREKLPYFRFHTHDAEGGCCERHPEGQLIFPEEWSHKKLARWKDRLGEYYYSCQFRNKPIPPGGNIFKSEWLRYFVFKAVDVKTIYPKTDSDFMKELTNQIQGQDTFASMPYLNIDHNKLISNRHKAVRHEMQQGKQMKDVMTSNLSKMLLVDPNHSGEKGRANNCILTLGFNFEPLNIYVLDGIAETCSRTDTVHKIYEMGEKWRIRTVWVETSAGQSWLKTLLEFENENRRRLGKWYFYEVKNFKDNRSENAKADRIEDTEIYFRRNQVWFNRFENVKFYNQFYKEYSEYPHCATKDIMDTFGHGMQNMEHSSMSEKEQKSFLQKQSEQFHKQLAGRSSITGY